MNTFYDTIIEYAVIATVILIVFFVLAAMAAPIALLLRRDRNDFERIKR